MRLKAAGWLGIAAVLGVAGAALALLVAYSGVINIAASAGHPALVEHFLELGMRRSVQQHSSDIAVPADLDDRERIRLGAAHFAGGCAECHGAPGSPRNPIYDHMLPVPPDLAAQSGQWRANELFFIVRHGLQFTGMPEWSGGERPDEVWSMVAFLAALPALSVNEYRALATGNGEPASADVVTLREEGGMELAREACDRCHDTAQAATTTGLVPRLAGQPAPYLARSLHEYRSGERRSGFMQPVAGMLSDEQIEQLAQHYSQMPAAVTTPDNQPTPEQEAEAALIANGLHPELRLPACLSCHGGSGRGDYPVLGGQNAAYIAQQLQLWRNGGRQQSAWGQVMAVIAARLQPEQIDMLAQWFAQQPRPATSE